MGCQANALLFAGLHPSADKKAIEDGRISQEMFMEAGVRVDFSASEDDTA